MAQHSLGGQINLGGLLALLLLFSLSFSQSQIRLPDQSKTLGRVLPSVSFVDDSGKVVRLMDILDNKPLIVAPIYTRCETACPLIATGLKEAVKRMGGLGKDYNVLFLSFDPSDNPRKLREFRRRLGLEGFLIGGGGETSHFLKALDFDYFYDKTSEEFLHPNLVAILSPNGRLSRYIFGVKYDPLELKLSLLDAKRGVVKLSPVEGLLLRCFRYDPFTGTYRFDWSIVVEIASGIAFFITVLMVFFREELLRLFKNAYMFMMSIIA